MFERSSGGGWIFVGGQIRGRTITQGLLRR
jgi:hypothetical protein